MINPFHEVNWNPGMAERRTFAKSLVIGFPCISIVFLLIGWIRHGAWDHNLPLACWLTGVGAGMGLLFWAIPAIAKPFYMAWYFISCCIGLVMSNLILGGFFYLVLTPFGLVKRAFNNKAFPKGFDRQAPTYWRDAESIKDVSRYYKQF